MKRTLKFSLLAVLLLLSASTQASVLSVKIENSSTINVTLSNIIKGQKLSLKDYYGVKLFDITLTAMPSYKKLFDFKTVKGGIYFIETETDFDVKITPVVNNAYGVSLINNSTITIFKPTILLKDKILMMNMTRVAKVPLLISIYDKNGSLIFDEKFEGDMAVVKRTYNLEKLPKGEYDMHFDISGERVFIKDFTL